MKKSKTKPKLKNELVKDITPFAVLSILLSCCMTIIKDLWFSYIISFFCAMYTIIVIIRKIRGKEKIIHIFLYLGFLILISISLIFNMLKTNPLFEKAIKYESYSDIKFSVFKNWPLGFKNDLTFEQSGLLDSYGRFEPWMPFAMIDTMYQIEDSLYQTGEAEYSNIPRYKKLPLDECEKVIKQMQSKIYNTDLNDTGMILQLYAELINNYGRQNFNDYGFANYLHRQYINPFLVNQIVSFENINPVYNNFFYVKPSERGDAPKEVFPIDFFDVNYDGKIDNFRIKQNSPIQFELNACIQIDKEIIYLASIYNSSLVQLTVANVVGKNELDLIFAFRHFDDAEIYIFELENGKIKNKYSTRGQFYFTLFKDYICVRIGSQGCETYKFNDKDGYSLIRLGGWDYTTQEYDLSIDEVMIESFEKEDNSLELKGLD